MNVRGLTVSMAVSLLALGAVITPAHAAHVDAVVMGGSGTYLPGLDAVPATQYVSINATLGAVGTDNLSYACNLSGTAVEGLAGGNGTLSGACGPVTFTSCMYSRVGAVASLTCLTTTVGEITATMEWTPRNALPTTSVDLLGGGEWVDTAPTSGGPASSIGGVLVAGDGWISPGLGATPVTQTFRIEAPNLTTINAEGTVGIGGCYWSGTGISDSLAEGVGSLSGSCGQFSTPSCAYVRVGLVMSVECAGVVEATHGDFQITPHDVNPTTSFTIYGVMVGIAR